MGKIKREEELVQKIAAKYKNLTGTFNERTRRLWAGSESMAIGYGGIAIVSEATGLARDTIIKGMNEIKNGRELKNRVRGHGGGRKKEVDKEPGIMKELAMLVESSTRGDPESPLIWQSKGLRKLSSKLREKGYNVSHVLVERLLHGMEYNLKSNRKKNEGGSHPDRDLQFEHINASAGEFMDENQPVISVDTKKKELMGNFKNNGKEWKGKGEYDEVNVYDFLQLSDGRASPYGIYDMKLNEGYVNVGIDHDTAEFAVESIRRWWNLMGRRRYPDAKKLLITADGGESNGSRVRLWKVELQRLATETGMEISVCHFPPGTSRWNKIEHRMFSFISKNWRDRPPVSFEVIVNLIANTRTEKGLRVEWSLDHDSYEKGIKISKEQMANLNILMDEFHGERNYTIKPK
ncbi:ISAzo13 family transposase [Ferroplasma sp.]|uniref:ISAzo13 family transposase n=1 Tax=Ferroplasma sp. TaxID=2591003 RepID=UPI00262BA2EA|nr:ISAzo13 family transposase [Ferroplasma sp.]